MSHTININGKKFELSDEFKQSIQRRARGEYSENWQFSCWWKTGESGEAILVIETEGPMAPWDALDQQEVEMQDLDTQSIDSDDDVQDIDAGNGMKTLPPEDDTSNDASDDESDEINRSHFPITPKNFEEVPSPDGDDPDKIPPRPERMPDGPQLVTWVPEDPDKDEVWAAGEAITPVASWVEWNIQARADEVGHDHYESLCVAHDCEKVGEYQPSQTPTKSGESGSVKRKGKKQFEEGKYGGDNWQV